MKYGFTVQEEDVTAPGGQYVMLRAESADLAPGTWVDLLRQRKAGVALQAFHGFQGFNNYIVTKPAVADPLVCGYQGQAAWASSARRFSIG